MKKAILLIACGLVLLSAVGLGVYNWLDRGQGDQAENEADASEREELQDQRKEIEGEISQEDLEGFVDEGLNPFGMSTQMSEMTDTTYQEYIHGMSHQKVEASKKWGFYEIHPERTGWLLDGLDQVDLNHEETYREILEKWNDSDFSTADDDHNAIWSLQGGTVGRATGILNPEEEQEYVDSNAD